MEELVNVEDRKKKTSGGSGNVLFFDLGAGNKCISL